jgi:hypothetical protein
MLIIGEQTKYDTFLYMFMISLPPIYMLISHDSLIVAIRLLGTVAITLFSVIKEDISLAEFLAFLKDLLMIFSSEPYTKYR